MTTEQNVIFDRFLNEVAPKLDAASANTCVLTAEEVVLTVAGLDLAAAITAEAKGISLESARSEVFAPLHTCLHFDTEQELLAAMHEVHAVPPTDKGLALIGNILAKSGVLISQILRRCFTRAQATIRAFCGWTLPLCHQAADYIKTRYDESLSAISEHGKIMWSWVTRSTVIIAHASMNCIAAAAGYAHAALAFLFRGLLDTLKAIDRKLGDWTMSLPCMKTMTQCVAISKPCNISLPHVVYFISAGITYIRVTMTPGTGEWALLKQEIAGCGMLCR